MRKSSFLLLFAPFLALGISPAMADTHLASIGGGVVIPTPMGFNYEAFSRSTGFQAETLIRSDDYLGPHLSAHIFAGYEPWAIRGLESTTLKQFLLMAGPETRWDAGGFFLKPFFGLDFGAAYSMLTYSTSANTSNTDLSFAMQVRPGFEIPIADSISVTYSMPARVIWDKSKFTTLDNIFSLRIAL